MLSLSELWPLCPRLFQFIGKRTLGSCDDKEFRKGILFVLSGGGVSGLINHTRVSAAGSAYKIFLLFPTSGVLWAINQGTNCLGA